MHSRPRHSSVRVHDFRIQYYPKPGGHASLSCMLASFGSTAVTVGTAQALMAAFGRLYALRLCFLPLWKPDKELSLDRKSLLCSLRCGKLGGSRAASQALWH